MPDSEKFKQGKYWIVKIWRMQDWYDDDPERREEAEYFLDNAVQKDLT